MNEYNSVRLISLEQLLDSGCFDMKKSIGIAEKAILDFHNGKILFPDKVCQIFEKESQNRINCLPATLLEEKVCGMKWVSVFPGNPVKYNLQNVSALIVLSEIKTGFPIAVMEGSLCSGMRTASVSAVAAKYLAKTSSKNIGFIGSGEQAKMHFIAMKTIFPEINVCDISSNNYDSQMDFASSLSPLYPDVCFTCYKDNYREAVSGKDIIITAISGQEPVLQPEWVKPGCFYCHIGGWEDSYDVPLKADKIVCDCWSVVKHRTQTISRLYQMGKLNDNDIYADIDEIVSGEKARRENDNEFIYFNAVGLSYVDIAVAYEMYKQICKNNDGEIFSLQDSNIFSHGLYRNEEGKILLRNKKD